MERDCYVYTLFAMNEPIIMVYTGCEYVKATYTDLRQMSSIPV